MKTRIVTAVVVASIASMTSGAPPDIGKQEKTARRPAMPVSVVPFYDSNGPTISVGEYSDKLRRADAKSLVDLCAELKKNRDTLRPEVMYVAAIRLYDLGHKDDAVYWFYTAQYRARVFSSLLDEDKVGTVGSEAFELRQAYSSFNQLAGEYINGYAFGDLPKLEQTLQTVVDEGKSMPKLGDLFPKVHFVDGKVWAAKNKVVSDGLASLIESVKANADSIKQQRKQNGIEGKY